MNNKEHEIMKSLARKRPDIIVFAASAETLTKSVHKSSTSWNLRMPAKADLQSY